MLEAILQGMDSIEKRITSETEALRQDINRVNLTMENEIKPNIQLLAEGFARLPDFHKMESAGKNQRVLAKTVLVSREVRRSFVVATARNYESKKKSKKKYVLLKGD